MKAYLIAAMCAALAVPAAAQTVTASEPAPAAVAGPAVAKTLKLQEGTEVEIEFGDKLSSATASAGDRFSIILSDSIKVGDVTIPSGYAGRGEVVSADKKGYMGKAGELNVRLEYIRIGDTRVRLRASKGGEGKGAMGATVALTVLFGPLGLLKRGHDIEIQRGQAMMAYLDQDAEITLPLAPPPERD